MKDLKPFDAIIFDLDGTLSDTMPIHYKAFCVAFKKYNINNFSEELFYSLAGVPADKITERILKENNVDKDSMLVADEKDSIFHELSNDIRPIKKTIDLARKYSDQKKLAVATGSIRWSAEESLEKLEIKGLFQEVVCSDDISNPKPDPEIFILAAKKLNVEPKHCIVIEDSPLGIEGALKAGMQAIHIDEIPDS